MGVSNKALLFSLDQMAKACHQTRWKPVPGFTLVPQCHRGSDVPTEKHTIKRTSPASTACGWTVTRALTVLMHCCVLSCSNSIMRVRVMSALQKGDRSSEMIRVLPTISHTGCDEQFLTPELTLQNLYTYLWRACVRFLLKGKWRGKLGKHLMSTVSSKHHLVSLLEPSDYKIDGTVFSPPKLTTES